jgi:hypothetical protein
LAYNPARWEARGIPLLFQLDSSNNALFRHRTTDPSKPDAPRDLDLIPVRPISLAPMRAARVGLVDCGLPLVATAWEKMSTAWVVSNQRSLMRRYAPNKPTPKGWDTVARAPTNLLDRYPVDIIISTRSKPSGTRSTEPSGTRSTEPSGTRSTEPSGTRSTEPSGTRSKEPDWFRLIKQTTSKNLPRVVREPCSSAALAMHHGDKGLRIWMLAIGYCQRCVLVSNTDEGGAVSSDRLVTLYTLIRSLPTSDPEDYDPLTEALTLGVTGLRAMPNLRRPCNVPRMAMVGNKSIGTRQRTRTHATVTGCSDPNSTGCPMTPTRQSY